MNTNSTHPKWWQVYLTFPLLIALFMLDHSLKLSERGHVVLQIGILLFVYWLIHMWLKSNAAALSNTDQRQFHGTVIITRVPIHQLPDTKTDNRPIFQFTNSEIKGILSDTFEMETIDAEFLPIDEVSQE
jgi:hypothetical protein